MHAKRCIGCGQIVTGRCPCRRSAASRGYDATWQRIRLAHLARWPRCSACGGAASDVDHVLALRHGGTHEARNLRSLCHSCHSKRTNVEA